MLCAGSDPPGPGRGYALSRFLVGGSAAGRFDRWVAATPVVVGLVDLFHLRSLGRRSRLAALGRSD